VLLLAIGIFAFVFNLPVHFELSWAYCYDTHTADRSAMIMPAELRVNQVYVVAYKLIINTVCVSAGPFTIICLLAAATVHAVHKSGNTTDVSSMRNRNEGHANAMAMLLAVKFVLCYSLTIAITLFEAVIGVDDPNESRRRVSSVSIGLVHL
jgi:hypothetical protein